MTTSIAIEPTPVRHRAWWRELPPRCRRRCDVSPCAASCDFYRGLSRRRPDSARPVQLVARRHVAGGIEAQPPRARTRAAATRRLLPRTTRPLGAGGDEPRVLRRAQRAVEAARLVRAVRPRDVHGRAGDVQSRDDRAGAAALRRRRSGTGVRRSESWGYGRRSSLAGDEAPDHRDDRARVRRAVRLARHHAGRA